MIYWILGGMAVIALVSWIAVRTYFKRGHRKMMREGYPDFMYAND